jgi:hypothetical protein
MATNRTSRINKELGWMTSAGPRKFGFGGVQKFVLDMHFLLFFYRSEITPETNKCANDLCQRALKQYLSQHKDLSTPLQVIFI